MTRHEELLAVVSERRTAVLDAERRRSTLLAALDESVHDAYLHGVPVVRIVTAGGWATRKSVRDALLRHRRRQAKESAWTL